ncbi:MAG: hypothetical protein ACK4J0_04165 [Candidatus Anstonellaceae archaeon]
MNILKILKTSLENTVENASFLLINDLMLAYSTLVSFGVFVTFFLIGLSFSYYFIGPNNSVYLPITLFIIFLGICSSLLFLFPAFGTYLNFTYESIRIKRRYNLMEELEHFDKNLIPYIITGILEYGPILFLGLVFFLVWIIFQKNILLGVFFLFLFLITSIVYCSFTFLVYPAVVIDKKKIMSAFSISIALGRKYFIQAIISLILLNALKIMGMLLVFVYPIFFYYIYVPIYSYFVIYYYKAASSRL